jgi:hypothetical protein
MNTSLLLPSTLPCRHAVWMLCLCFSLGGAATSAATVYRCGPDGRSYSDTPCANGRAIEVRDERSNEQRVQAAQAARAEAQLADALRGERHAREAAAAVPMLPAAIKPLPSKAELKKERQRGDRDKRRRQHDGAWRDDDERPAGPRPPKKLRHEHQAPAAGTAPTR